MSFSSKLSMLMFLCSLFIHASLADVVCEDLQKDLCAFSISSSGKRCLLETEKAADGRVNYECKTSEVEVERMAGYIETNQCVNTCGLERNSIGISSDALLEPQFTSKLCSPSCYHNCPNIVDLYFNLAAGEGVYLPDLCEMQKNDARRAMVELVSSGSAPSPASFVSHAMHAAFASSPM